MPGIHVRENWRAIRVQHRTLAKTIKTINTTQKAKRMSSTDSQKPGVNPGVRAMDFFLSYIFSFLTYQQDLLTGHEYGYLCLIRNMNCYR
jgi:hypothetical protein